MTLSRARRSGASRRPTTWSGLVAGAALLLAVASGCGKPAKSADPPERQGLSTVEPSSTPTDPGAAASIGSTTHPSGAPATTRPKSSGGGLSTAQIISFKPTQQPLCAIAGTTAAPYHRDAQDIILAWQVTGATGVDLYLDGGLYGSYAATGSQQLFFACQTKPKQSHTYKLITKGGPGQPASRSLTVTADNNPPTN
jgi:hypothetical protein